MDNEVDEYIKKQDSPQREICTELRKIILNTFPGIEEEMKWGVPAYGKDLFYIGALKKQVNLGFKIEALKDDDLKLFEGTGKTMRHIKVYSTDKMDEERIVSLLKLVYEKHRI